MFYMKLSKKKKSQHVEKTLTSHPSIVVRSRVKVPLIIGINDCSKTPTQGIEMFVIGSARPPAHYHHHCAPHHHHHHHTVINTRTYSSTHSQQHHQENGGPRSPRDTKAEVHDLY